MAGVLERSESTPTSSLRMELMQGLVKMAWGTASSREGVGSRGSFSSSGAAGAQPDSSNSGGTGIAPLERQAPTKPGSSKSRERSDSVDSSRWSELEVGNGSADGEGAPPPASSRGKPGGARDIFNMPYTEQVRCGWAGRCGNRCANNSIDV